MADDPNTSPNEDLETPPSGKQAADTDQREQADEIADIMDYFEGKTSPRQQLQDGPPPEDDSAAQPPEGDQDAVSVTEQASQMAAEREGEAPPASETPPPEAESKPPAAEESEDVTALRTKIAELSARLAGQQPPPATPPQPTQEQQQAWQQQRPDYGKPREYVDQERLEDALSDATKFNTLMSDIERQREERIFSIIPGLMADSISRQFQVERALSDFDEANPDLRQYRDLVVATAGRVETDPANAGKPLPEILKLTEEEVRNTLRLKRPERSSDGATVTPMAKPKERPKPALPQRSPARNRRQPVKRGPKTQQDHMDDVLSHMEGEGMLRS